VVIPAGIIFLEAKNLLPIRRVSITLIPKPNWIQH
jgi:hypothetical protein